VKLKEHLIREIAGELECGNLCFVNKADFSLEYYPANYDDMGWEENPWQDVIDKIKKKPKDYLEFEPMDSNQSFKIMREFAELIAKDNLQDELIKTLNRSSPFRNFKNVIDNSGEFRQKWFDFRDEQYIIWVNNQIN